MTKRPEINYSVFFETRFRWPCVSLYIVQGVIMKTGENYIMRRVIVCTTRVIKLREATWVRHKERCGEVENPSEIVFI